jgi:hypothetical protein
MFGGGKVGGDERQSVGRRRKVRKRERKKTSGGHGRYGIPKINPRRKKE